MNLVAKYMTIISEHGKKQGVLPKLLTVHKGTLYVWQRWNKTWVISPKTVSFMKGEIVMGRVKKI